MILSLNNIVQVLEVENPIKKSRVFGSNRINHYRLLEEIKVQLSCGSVIDIPKGFQWDLASVPRIIWNICAPDNDAEIAYLIHDYLYRVKAFPKTKCDKEMYLWATTTNGTNKISIKNIDNKLRYLAVKFFGKSSYYAKH